MTEIEETPSHLQYSKERRGFKDYPPIVTDRNDMIRLAESSIAEQSRMYLFIECPSDLNDPNSPPIEASVHLSAEQALMLAEQLQHLYAHHYHREYFDDGELMTPEKFWADPK